MIVKVKYNNIDDNQDKERNNIGCFILVLILLFMPVFIAIFNTIIHKDEITETNQNNTIKTTSAAKTTTTNKTTSTYKDNITNIKPLVKINNTKKEIINDIGLILDTNMEYTDKKYELTLTEIDIINYINEINTIDNEETINLKNITIEKYKKYLKLYYEDDAKEINKLNKDIISLHDQQTKEILEICDKKNISVKTNKVYKEEYELYFINYTFAY